MSQPELLYVEQPAVDQLQSNGWSYKDGRELIQNNYELKIHMDLKELKIVLFRFFKG